MKLTANDLITAVLEGNSATKLIDSIGADRSNLLQAKFMSAVATQPLWTKLKSRLVTIGGDQVVIPNYEPDLKRILTRGTEFGGSSQVIKGKRSNCHGNVSDLYDADAVDSIVTGYALSSDGLWRQHTWGLKGGVVIETTEKRTKYYGVVLNSKEASDFADRN